jgi:penicillin-binding protein 1C
VASRAGSETTLRLSRGPLLRALLYCGAPALLAALLLRLPWPALDAILSDPGGCPITDRNGALLALTPARDGAFQERTAMGGMPRACGDIFVQLEDQRFYAHPGVDILAAARAGSDLLLGRGSRSGASTIAMQLSRIVAPHGPGMAGKLVEAADAVRLESLLGRGRVLELYLNKVPFGRNTRGVGAAAWTYFGTDVSTLGPAQLLALAVIPRNPTLYDPFENPGRLIATASAISARRALGIDAADIERAVRGAVTRRPAAAAPHFARFVSARLAGGTLHPSGAEARTTLDLALNDFIQDRISFILERYAAARVSNAAAVVIENATGAVLGWVGSRDFFDAAHAGQIDGVLIRRQSASTLKPFLYARALESGWTAATLLPDVPIVFGAADEEAYSPQNFDNRSHGVVRLRTALASSLNVPAVYTLSRVGLDSFLETLGDLGFALPEDARARYGLGTAIGNAEVSLLELTRAFSTFPRGGTLPDLLLLAGQKHGQRRVFDPFASGMICSILSDPSARATGFGTRTWFRTPFPAMFKSGTSSEFTNLWCVGATPRYTVGAWAGNFDGRAVINKTGSIVPAQIVADVMRHLEGGGATAGQRRDFAMPASVVRARICTLTGRAATASCPATRMEYFRASTEIPGPCAFHGRPGGRAALLEEAFLAAGESARILFPVSGQVFYLDETLRGGAQGVPVLVAVRRGLQATLTVDGREIRRESSLSGSTIPLTRGGHQVVVMTELGSDRVFFEGR